MELWYAQHVFIDYCEQKRDCAVVVWEQGFGCTTANIYLALTRASATPNTQIVYYCDTTRQGYNTLCACEELASSRWMSLRNKSHLIDRNDTVYLENGSTITFGTIKNSSIRRIEPDFIIVDVWDYSDESLDPLRVPRIRAPMVVNVLIENMSSSFTKSPYMELSSRTVYKGRLLPVLMRAFTRADVLAVYLVRYFL